jgi:D-methionine transport system ATP-binding protein
MIFQGFNLLSARTIEDNVALPLRLMGVRRKEAVRRALEALELVGLADKARVYPGHLSGGQQQRAGIARAIVQKPSLLLSDEATSALDPETTYSILALLKDINRRFGLTIILITHEMEVIRQIAERVAVIETGRIVEIGPAWQIFGNPSHGATRALLQPDDARMPRDILARIDDVVFEINYSGAQAEDLDLFALATTLGPGARLLQGGLDRIQGRAQGRLLVALKRDQVVEVQATLTRLRTIVPGTEVVVHAH